MPDSRLREVGGGGPRIGRELAVEIVQVDPATVVDVRGDVVAGTIPLLRAVLDTAVAASAPTLEIDLTGVRLLDSCGLLVLMDVRRACFDRGRAFALRGFGPAVRHLLATVGESPCAEMVGARAS